MRNIFLVTAFTCFSILSLDFSMNQAEAKESASSVPYDAKFLDQFSWSAKQLKDPPHSCTGPQV